MKVIYSKPKGLRIKKVSRKYRPFFITPYMSNLWFNLQTGEWEECRDFTKGDRTSAYYAMEGSGYKNVYSLKAAKRRIAKWNVPKGTIFSVSLFVGHFFLITK